MRKLTLRAREILADAIHPEGRERRQLAERAAETDSLTKVANRRALDRALPAAEKDESVAVVFFDGDNFGKVNKLLGHRAGDEAVKDLALVIQSTADSLGHGYGARVFRSGGDEFVVLIPFRLSNLLRDMVEVNYGRIVRPLKELGVTGTIGNTMAEADGLQAYRKRQHAEGRLLTCRETSSSRGGRTT